MAMFPSRELRRRLAPAAYLVLPCFALPAAAQTTWLVDVSAPGPGQGTPSEPYSSIQYAIDQPTTVDHDTLLVAPGTYVENVDFGSKSIAVVSSAGPAATVIRAAGPGPVVTLATEASLQFHRFEGFTVTGSMGPDDAGILVPELGFPVVRQVVVRDCAGPGVRNGYDLILQQATLTGNGIGLENTGLGVLWDTRELIVWGNALETQIIPYFGSSPIEASIIPPGPAVGASCIYVDPLFWNAAKSDLHLKAGSPAIQPGGYWGAIEFDPGYVPPVAIECVTAPNSVGAGAVMDWGGSNSVSGADLALHVGHAPPGVLGLFYYGAESVQLPFGDGFRCVGGGALGIFRLEPQVTSANGRATTALDFAAPPVGAGPGAIAPGTGWTFQFWYRDPTGPLGTGFNLSDALRAQFAP
jgi:hypothetical protein